MSTRYLEAKPQRAVGLGEVRLAIVPEGTSQEIIRDLENRGIPVKVYERGNEQQRNTIVSRETSERGLRFHAAMARGREDFDATRDRAVAERGIVMPGLNETEVRVVEVPRHEFKGERPISQARKWAKERIVGEYTLTDSRGDEVPYSISGRAIDKYLSSSAIDKSADLGVHLSVLTKLPEVISESIEAEIHPDYFKGEDGIRRPNNGHHADKLIHRFYGIVNIDGENYRVKTTIIETRDNKVTTIPHSFEVTEIELLPKDNSSIKVEPTVSPNNSGVPHRTAKLLQGVEKSYDPGKKLLDESEKSGTMVRESSLFDWNRETRSEAAAPKPVEGSTKRERIERLRKSEPVVVTARMIPEDVDLTDRKAVKSALKENIRAIVVNADTGEKIAVFKDGINEVTSHGMSDMAHVKSLFAIPEMLRSSIFIDERENEKDHTDFDKYRYYVCGLQIDGQDYTAKIVIGVKSENRYYDHRLSQIEKGKLIDSLNGLSNSEAENEQSSSGYKGMTLERLLQINDGENGNVQGNPTADLRFREVEAVSRRFDEELDMYERGELAAGHRFELGVPSDYLRSAGFPALPISMRSSLLARKAGDEKHPFEASDLKGLVDAIQKPIAIFEYTKANMRNLIVDVKRGDKHFLVGVTLNYKAGDIEINSVSGLFPKESHEWVKWIQDGKAIRIDQKEKVLAIIDSLRTNPAESERIGLNLDMSAKLVKNFVNPTMKDGGGTDGMAQTSAEAKSEYAERLSQRFNTPIKVVTDINELPAVLRNKKGAYDVGSGEIVVVIPNNATVEDVAETVFHELVAHRGLRELIGEENYDSFCDEVYDHLKDDLKREVDTDATRRFMNEPEKGYGHHRRVAVDELFGRMSEKGFEDFSKAERGIWAKLKAKVLEAINKFLGALKLPKWIKLGDNELRYMLWRSHERLREKGDYVDMARDAAKREELGLTRNDAVRERKDAGSVTADRIEHLFDAAVSGDLKGKPVEVGRLTAEGREYLEKLSGVKMKEDVSFVLNPSDLVHMYRNHFGNNEKDKGNNIPLTKEDIRAIADVVSAPERIIFGVEPDGMKRNLFYFLAPAKEGAYNLLEIYGDRKGNLTAKTFYKTRKGVSQRVLSLMKSEHLTSVTDGATLSDGAKLPKFFENPTIAGEESPDYRFREVSTGGGREEYDKRVRVRKKRRASDKKAEKPTNRLAQLHEAYFDSMRSLRVLQEAVSHETGKPIDSDEDAYEFENQLSSRNKVDEEEYHREFLQPMFAAIAAIED